MDRKNLIELAECIAEGQDPGSEAYRDLATLPESRFFTLLAGADLIRDRYFGKHVHLCAICNGKSGRCSEDCAFCSQSKVAGTDAPVYPLLEAEKMREGGTRVAAAPVDRYAVVTSGRRIPRAEVYAVAEALEGLKGERIGLCTSLGILGEEDFRILKAAGVTRYHHNLETAESHFEHICTTHTYRERVATVEAARSAGFSICSGGIFGVGETDEQVIELGLALKELQVDAVPVNFLVPIPGTRLGESEPISPLRCLKIIAVLRFILPGADILVCGGRESAMRDMHPLVFYAGASGVMTDDYLTTAGRSLQDDLEMLERLGFKPRKAADRVFK